MAGQAHRRVVVVTGASSGIGRDTALRFARRGASVVVAARRTDVLTDLATRCATLGGTAIAFGVDVTDGDAVEQLAQATVDHFGRIDVWVNNASVYQFGRFLDVPAEDFHRVVDVNFFGYVHGARAALRRFTEQGRGVLINVDSVLGVVPQPYTSSYVASKHAVRGFSRSLRQEMYLDGAHDVHVCAVLPGTMDTPLFGHAGNRTGRLGRALPPVYPPTKVARTIVRLVDRPRAEVVVGGMARLMAQQSKVTPRLVDRTLAVMTDRLQLPRGTSAELTDGNLFTPSPDGDATVTGGWHGRARTTARTAAGIGALGAVLVVARRLRRG